MRRFNVSFSSYHVLLYVLFFSIQTATADDHKITGKVVLDGGYRTTEKKPAPGMAPNEYNKERTKVTAHYEIETKTNPKTGKKEFDLSKSKVIFENEFQVDGKNFKTDPVPITKIEVDPKTGKIKSFDVKGKKWDPEKPDESDGIEGHIELPVGKKPAKGWLISRYKLKSGSEYGYTFNTVTKPKSKPKETEKGNTKQPEQSTSQTSAMSYDSANQTLSLGNHQVFETPNLSDPIIGSDLMFDSYEFWGLNPTKDLAVFWSQNDGIFNMMKGGEHYQHAKIPIIYYSISDDLFYGGIFENHFSGMDPTSPFFDSLLSSIASDHFNGLTQFLDHESQKYHSKLDQYFTITPDVNYFDLTQGFTQSAQNTSGIGRQLAAYSVSEPASIGLMLSLLMSLLLFSSHYANRKI